MVVMGILAAISFASYRTMKADSEAKTCETKLIALQAAFNSCVMEKSVSDCLDPTNQPFRTNIALENLRYISCPADKTSPETGGVSYGYNTALDNLTSRQYQRMPEDLIIIGDCDSGNFTINDPTKLPLIKRHTKYEVTGSKTFALAITKAYRTSQGINQGKRIKRITSETGNEACHAAYQECLTGCFNTYKDSEDTAARASCYSGCIASDLVPACSSDYE